MFCISYIVRQRKRVSVEIFQFPEKSSASDELHQTSDSGGGFQFSARAVEGGVGGGEDGGWGGGVG